MVIPFSLAVESDRHSSTIVPRVLAATARQRATVIGTALCGCPTLTALAIKSNSSVFNSIFERRRCVLGFETMHIFGMLPGTSVKVRARPIFTPANLLILSSLSRRPVFPSKLIWQDGCICIDILCTNKDAWVSSINTAYYDTINGVHNIIRRK